MQNLCPGLPAYPPGPALCPKPKPFRQPWKGGPPCGVLKSGLLPNICMFTMTLSLKSAHVRADLGHENLETH